MNHTRAKLTVLFEEPFWIGLYERESDRKYEVCKITFGAEPKDFEVYRFFLDNWHKLRFSPTIQTAATIERQRNPKRQQREAHKAVQNACIGTKAQQAMKLQQEQGKLERKVKTKEEREAEAQRKFELRQEKRREKHNGH